MLQVKDPDLSTDVLQVESPDLASRKRKRKANSDKRLATGVTGLDPRNSVPIQEVVDSEEECEEGTRVAMGSVKYPIKKIIGLMSEIPSDQDWERMEEGGLVTTFKEIGSLWGQVSLNRFFFSSCFNPAYHILYH